MRRKPTLVFDIMLLICLLPALSPAVLAEGNGPVITDLRFEELGDTLYPEPTELHLTFSAETGGVPLSQEHTCIDVEIYERILEISHEYHGIQSTAIEQQEDGTWRATFPITEVFEWSDLRITKVQIGNATGHVTEVPSYVDGNGDIFHCSFDTDYRQEIAVYNVCLSTDTVTLTDEEFRGEITVSADLSVTERFRGGGNFRFRFQNENDPADIIVRGGFGAKQFADGTWRVTATIPVDHDAEGTYTLVAIQYGDNSLPFDDPVSYTVVNSITPISERFLIPGLMTWYTVALVMMVVLLIHTAWKPKLVKWIGLYLLEAAAAAAAGFLGPYYDSIQVFTGPFPGLAFSEEVLGSMLFTLVYVAMLVITVIVQACCMLFRKSKP